ncbi:MobF family relaxase [Corynebacterium sp. A21]|uniref:MobF family relaxase n=1 Tax=Corynebacterium sp. A21 TaxID=3457318 RepID=UPI003FD1F159
MMSIRAVHAGDGYAYLLNSVASHDDTTRPNTRLGDYYDATGTPPGRWFGQGIQGLGETTVSVDGIVEEDQMAALYGEGFHPDADAKIDAGASLKDVQLGRAYPSYSKGNAVLEAVKDAEKSFREEHGRRPNQSERNLIGLEVARPFYEAEQGVSASSPREVLAWLNEEKNNVKQAVSAADLTFSPTKSVSVLWALGDDDTRKAIERIHQDSVQESLTWIEDNLLYTRTGSRGERQIKAKGMIAATFVHYDTRAGDPDLHTHCLISNKVQADPETSGLTPEDAAKWRSLDASVLFKNSARIGQRYQRMMVQRLGEELGLDFYDRSTQADKQPVWEIAGIDESLIEKFSHRRTTARPVYEQYAAEYAKTHGHAPSDRAQYALWQQAILDTRDAKKPAQSLADHRVQWAQMHDGQPLSVEALQGFAQREFFPDKDATTYRQAVMSLAVQAVEDTRSRRAEFQVRHLDTSLSTRLNQWRFTSEQDAEHARTAAFDHAMTHLIVGLGATHNETLPEALLHEDGRVIDQDAESKTLTAHATLREENTVLDALNEPTAWTVSHASVVTVITNNATDKGFALNTGQQLLASHLTESGAQVTAGVGPAGTGKTASMAVVADIWRAHDRNVVALAPSATAAQQLGEDINAEGATLASLTYRWRGIVGKNPRSVEHLGVDIKPGDMLLLDEAGMATTADLASLVEIADATGAVVRMVGDPHQLDAVETGGLFRTIVKRDQSVELDQVMRMGADTAQADAGLALRHGDVRGLDLYHERGWVHHGSRAEMVAKAAGQHLDDEAAGRSAILIASTRDDVNTANHIIRDTRIQSGLVETDGPQVTLGTGHQASVGDVILTRKNQTINGHRVLNGHRFTVTGVREDGGLVVVDEQRQRPHILPGSYVSEHVQLGYAATVHRAQGVTVDVTRAVVGAETDRRGLYVAMTRGKKQNHVYVAEDTRIDLDSEDAHWHMSGEHQAPDYRQILSAIVEKDDGQRSATDLHRALIAQETSDQRKGELLMTATDMLTTKWRRSVVEPDVRTRLDRLPVADLEALDEDQAVERISTAIVRLSQHGIDYRELMEEATANLEGSRDVGAVIAARLVQEIPDESPVINHLPLVHAGTDTELHDWAESIREELDQVSGRELRSLEYPLPAKGEVTGRDFTNADLRGMELTGLQFIDCDFDGAAFDDAQIHRVTFKDCSMTNTTFTGTDFGSGDSAFTLSPLIRCNLDGADFTGAKLVRSRFTGCSMQETNFTRAEISGRFQHVDLTGAEFAQSEITNAVSVADSTLDDDAPESLHRAQGTTVDDREQRRQERMAQKDAAQDNSYTAVSGQQVAGHQIKTSGLDL